MTEPTPAADDVEVPAVEIAPDDDTVAGAEQTNYAQALADYTPIREGE